MEKIKIIKENIKSIPDFPKKGIIFRDITTLISNPVSFKAVIEAMEEALNLHELDRVVAIESRGFLFGSILAHKLGLPLELVRKPGKLPRQTFKETYDLEYGSDTLEIHTDALHKGDKVVIVDDLLATGGTAKATCKLIKQLEAQVIAAIFVVELQDLPGRKALEELENPPEVISLVKY
ncbi:MAG: adenine phosphoribosyltransferase [Deltaproteobacteria bacterium]|nr:adenine phosphoribosyltransferase [Deltaproteobacteria bacterium]